MLSTLTCHGPLVVVPISFSGAGTVPRTIRVRLTPERGTDGTGLSEAAGSQRENGPGRSRLVMGCESEREDERRRHGQRGAWKHGRTSETRNPATADGAR